MRLTRSTRVDADVHPGFHATETRSLQTSLHAALTAAERATGGAVPVEVAFDDGRDGGLVVVCRNLVVGFVPASRVPQLRAQRDAAGPRARLVAPGRLHPEGPLWRVWVGPVPDDGVPVADEAADVLAPPEPAVLGIPLRRGDG